MAYDTVCLHLLRYAVSLMHAGQPVLFKGIIRKRERMASHRPHHIILQLVCCISRERAPCSAGSLQLIEHNRRGT